MKKFVQINENNFRLEEGSTTIERIYGKLPNIPTQPETQIANVAKQFRNIQFLMFEEYQYADPQSRIALLYKMLGNMLRNIKSGGPVEIYPD